MTIAKRGIFKMAEEWVKMSDAAKIIGVTASKLSRLAALGKIKVQRNPYDERTRLVDLSELREMFPPRK
jgi:DNA-binding MarR family transcriptional regulator